MKLIGLVIFLGVLTVFSEEGLPKVDKIAKRKKHHVQYKLCKLMDSEEDICLICVTGYFIKNGRCLKCPKYCEKCDSGGCNRCHMGSFLEENRCVPCHKSCSSCTSLNSCDECAALYTLLEGKCVDRMEENPELVWQILASIGGIFVLFFLCGRVLVGGLDQIERKYKDDDGLKKYDNDEEYRDEGIFGDEEHDERLKLRGADETRDSEV